jgi:hypothetical protein
MARNPQSALGRARTLVGAGVLMLVAAACQSGVISSVAGTGTAGWSGDGDLATKAAVNVDRVAFGPSGSWYFSDATDGVVRKVDSSGNVSLFAGGGSPSSVTGLGDGGPAAGAILSSPTGLAVDTAGDVFIADAGDHVIREVAAGTNLITTFAGGGSATGDGGLATAALLADPTDLAFDSAGDLFFTEPSLGLIREVAAGTGVISSEAGGGTSLDNGVDASQAKLTGLGQIAVDGTSLDLALTNGIRQVDLGSHLITTLAGGGTTTVQGGGDELGDDGILATASNVSHALGLAVDVDHDVYFTDGYRLGGGSRVRKIDHTTGLVATVVGSPTGATGYAGDSGVGDAALLADPRGLAIGSGGSMLIADHGNNRVRQVTDVEHAPVSPTTTTVNSAPTSIIGGDPTLTYFTQNRNDPRITSPGPLSAPCKLSPANARATTRRRPTSCLGPPPSPTPTARFPSPTRSPPAARRSG